MASDLPAEPLAERLALALRREILRGKLAPGMAIKERDTAIEMGVSRTPMREAIRILAKEGLVDLRPLRSPVVANPTLKEIEDAITVLVTLEELSGQLAVLHASDAEIAAIRALHEAFQAHYDAGDPVDRFERDMALHLAIAQASHNLALAETHAAYLRRMWRARFLSARTRANRDRVLGDHDRIVAALERRDGAAVTQAIRAHLDSLLVSIRAGFAGQTAACRPAEDLID